MATWTKIWLEASQQPEFYVEGISEESAKTVSELLQENHEKHHIFFNRSGYHNHIAHHLLSLFALNASPSELKSAYVHNVSYQRPPAPLEQKVVEDLHDKEKFSTYLGKEKYYNDFLVFFQGEIGKSGWENVLNEYVFKGDERADDLLVRMFAGFLHPIIHLGFGIEFRQPAIIAEALAQACVHDKWIGDLFHRCEKAGWDNSNDNKPVKPIVQLLDEIHNDGRFGPEGAAHWDDSNKIRDGIMKREPEAMIGLASQYLVMHSDLEEKTAEMINAAVYYASTSQKPPHIPKYDFYFIHCVNASIFFSTFLSQPWLSTANKIRLLEWKVRLDLAMYASRGSPALLLDEATSYPDTASWSQIIERARKLPDDGHAAKLVRALAHGEKVSKRFEGKEGFRIKGEVWRRLGNMAIDSVEAEGEKWVRSAGFEEAWTGVPLREEGAARL